MTVLIATFYKFVPLPDYACLKDMYLESATRLGLRGSILLAAEGINATLSGASGSVLDFIAGLKTDARFADLAWRESRAPHKPFNRMKVRLKKEIIRMNTSNVDPRTHRGSYVDAAGWDALLADPDCVVVDARNCYEVALGTFRGAVNPRIRYFRDLPRWMDVHLEAQRHKKIAMFCTGGIRCEKSTSYLRSRGFERVYHLRGGILQYFQDAAAPDAGWDGLCFVFDDRVALSPSLAPRPDIALCPACSMPLTTDDVKQSMGDGMLCARCAVS